MKNNIKIIMKSSTIALLTDFGIKDNFVGVIKGVIRSIAPDSEIIDISNEIQSHDIRQAQFLLNSSYSFFPINTIFLCVVDPGVGSSRKAIAIRTDRYYFVGPDNGLFSNIIENEIIIGLCKLDNHQYFLSQVSNTFHGRDIFAPISAHIANGVKFKDLGSPLHPFDLVKLDNISPTISHNRIIGNIVYSDKFGNLVTNLPKSLIEPIKQSDFKIYFDDFLITKISNTFADVLPDEVLAYIGSTGYLEIGQRNGDLRALTIKSNEITIEFD